MALLPYADIDNLRSSLINGRSRHINKWKNQSELISPERFRQNIDRNNGARKDQRIINNLARRSLRTFVAGMMNGATSRARPWFKLTVTDEAKANRASSRKYFTSVEKSLNNYFQISNLYRILPMAYKDIGIFSNSAYAMLPHDRYGFYFMPFSMGSYCIANDAEGNVCIFERDFVLTVKQVVEMYGSKTPTGHIDWKDIDPWIKDMWDQARYVDEITLANVIVPNASPEKRSIHSYDKKYQSYTYIKAAGGNMPSQYSPGVRSGSMMGSGYAKSLAPTFISIKGYDYFPVIASRWELAAEDDYGVDGPGDVAVGDVATLQEMEKYRLEAVAKLVKPPMVGPASLRRHQASILAGGITYVDEADDTKKFRAAFEVDPRLSELVASKQDYEAAIRSAFYEDLFLRFAGQPRISHVTAEQIAKENEETLSALGPVLGQLDQDQNSKLIDNAFFILNAKNKLEKAPRELEGEELRPEYISILALAAKASQIVSSEKFVTFVGGMATTTQDPALLKMIKGDKMIRDYGDFVGIDPSSVQDEFEFDNTRQVQAAQQAQAMRAQQMAQAATTAKDMSAAKMGESNLLEQVAENPPEV